MTTRDHLASGNQTIRVREFGDLRFPNVADWIELQRKTFARPTGHLRRGSTLFNATNESTVTARVTQLGPTYGRVSGIQRGAA